MKRLQTRAAAAALSALLLASPACALAAETTPLTLRREQAEPNGQAAQPRLSLIHISEPTRRS